MWSPIYQMLAICILGLTVLGASLDYPVHPTESDLSSKGQCYAYLEDQVYNVTASLLPCMEKCPGVETCEVRTNSALLQQTSLPGFQTHLSSPFPKAMTLLRMLT